MKNICVYCGSGSGNDSAYLESAIQIADCLTDAGVGLVYGGASIGVMGQIADQVLARGGSVIGVIPNALLELEIAHQNLTELVVVSDMHKRKATMADRSDGFIALPGGFGTLEELFEMLTWSQLAIHQKPVGVLNVNGFYDRLFDFLDWQVEQGFVKPGHRELLLSSTDPQQLLDKLNSYAPQSVSKLWPELVVKT